MAGMIGGNGTRTDLPVFANGKRNETTPTRHDGFHDLRCSEGSVRTNASVSCDFRSESPIKTRPTSRLASCCTISGSNSTSRSSTGTSRFLCRTRRLGNEQRANSGFFVATNTRLCKTKVLAIYRHVKIVRKRVQHDLEKHDHVGYVLVLQLLFDLAPPTVHATRRPYSAETRLTAQHVHKLEIVMLLLFTSDTLYSSVSKYISTL